MQAAVIGAALAVLLVAAAADGAEPYKDVAGPYPVASASMEWTDAARNVVVPVKIYFPKDLNAAAAGNAASPVATSRGLPLIIFSHGLGGSRDGYQIWGEHWASYGYIVLHPTHVGSDSSVLKGLIGENGGLAEGAGRGELGAGGAAGTGGAEGARGAGAGLAAAAMAKLATAANVQNAVARCKDVSFIIDQMEKANAGTLQADQATMAVFKGKVDLKHIGMAGHSFGAITTMMIAGQAFGARGPRAGALAAGGAGTGGLGFSDPRVTAAIAMSAQPAAGDQKAAFGAIKIPILHITGTQDDAPIGLGSVKAADRRVPFDNSTAAGTDLVIFNGATHMTFAPTSAGVTLGTRVRELRAAAGEGRSANTPAQETQIHTLVKECTTAFWDQWLKGDEKAKVWLKDDFVTVMGTAGKFETK